MKIKELKWEEERTWHILYCGEFKVGQIRFIDNTYSGICYLSKFAFMIDEQEGLQIAKEKVEASYLSFIDKILISE